MAPCVVVHVTPGSDEFCVVPLNCCFAEEFTVAVPGVNVTASGGITITVALADLVGSFALVAVMYTVVLLVTLGEVNIPPPEIVPAVAIQVTLVSVVFVTVAWNGCCFDEFIETVVGLIVTLTAGVTVTVAVAEAVGSATLVAVTETVVSAVTLGPVNNPELDIEPCVADHFTDRSLELVTFAVNC
jgi:hypothetical protein